MPNESGEIPVIILSFLTQNLAVGTNFKIIDPQSRHL